MFLFRKSKTRDVNCSPPEGSKPPEPKNQYGVGENDLPTTKSPGVPGFSKISYKNVDFNELGIPILKPGTIPMPEVKPPKEDEKEITIVCSCGYTDVDIMSAVKRKIWADGKEYEIVDINYICPNCGYIQTKTAYLYER